MARDPELRISDADRERAVTKLSEHTAAGRLTHEELDERGDRVLAARTFGELDALFSDLPRHRSRTTTATPAPARSKDGSREHVRAYVLVNLMLIGIWAVTGAGYFWPIWPLMGWGIGLSTSLACRAAWPSRPRIPRS